MTDGLEEIVVIVNLVHVLPHFILMEPNWVSISSDEFFGIHAVNGEGSLHTLLLTTDENCHILFSAPFLFGLLLRSEFFLRFGHRQ
jgi:hypothetical protein